ncbi:MAG: hypothetical protein MH825_10520 [Cyanobacteria bacterium]|nr:hypothetical protein [Cyanobacteriota bacterium]
MDRIYTTEELVEILARERSACMRGQRLALHASASDNPHLDRVLPSDGLQKFRAYQQFRDTIHQYQRDRGVSGLVWGSVTLGDETLQFPMIHDQLLALPQDLAVLRGHLPVVLGFWRRSVAAMDWYWGGATGRQFSPVAPAEVARMADRSHWATIQKHERSDFLEVVLQLGWGNPTLARDRHGWPESGCEYIHAVKAGQRPIA